MIKEEKELLKKDICARLPYHLKVNYADKVYDVVGYYMDENLIILLPFMSNMESHPIETCKPYLRPMSSMTEEEKAEYDDLCYNCQEQDSVDYNISELDRTQLIYVIDWLNAHHFDFCNLIGRGLAIDCTDLNVY